MFLRRAAKFYVNWLYLAMLLRNAFVVATIAIIQAYNHSNGQPNWALIYIIGIIAFAESLIEHIGNAKFFALLQLIWTALQQLNTQITQQGIASKDTAYNPVPPRQSSQPQPPYRQG